MGKQETSKHTTTSMARAKFVASPQRLALPAWYLVKQFAGIYGVKMNYKGVKKLNRDVISRAYFDVAKLPAITRTVTYNNRGQPEKLPPIKSKDWIALILKRAAMGYNNRQFYESLANTIHPPPVKCACGAMVCSTGKATGKAHRNSKAHINGMLALHRWSGGPHIVTFPSKVKEGLIGGALVGDRTRRGIDHDIAPYIGGTFSGMHVNRSVSPPIVHITYAHHHYDSILNDLKAKSHIMNVVNGRPVCGPVNTRKNMVTVVRHPTYEQIDHLIMLSRRESNT